MEIIQLPIFQLWSQFMKIAQVHPNLVAREDALEYVEVGKNINLSINMNMNICILCIIYGICGGGQA